MFYILRRTRNKKKRGTKEGERSFMEKRREK